MTQLTTEVFLYGLAASWLLLIVAVVLAIRHLKSWHKKRSTLKASDITWFNKQ